MRSSWEAAFANYLDNKKTQWVYEPTSFILEDGSAYTPDFLVEDQHYIEIKGWMTNKALCKIESFKSQYPDCELQVLQKKDLIKMGVDLLSFKESERPKSKCEQCLSEFIKKDKRQKFCCIKCKNIWIANNKGKVNIKKKDL